jgi:hypothetical protein
MPKTTYIAKVTTQPDAPIAKIEIAIYKPPDYAGVVIKGSGDAPDVEHLVDELLRIANGGAG